MVVVAVDVVVVVGNVIRDDRIDVTLLFVAVEENKKKLIMKMLLLFFDKISSL